jgi:hypothetical protein
MQRERRLTLPAPLPPTPVDNDSEVKRLPDLKAFKDGDLRPTFILAINLLGAIPFEILLSNHAFNDANYLVDVHGNDETSVRFRSWAQSAMHWREAFEFAGRTWTAFKIQGQWKCIRATAESSTAVHSANDRKETPLKLNEDTIRELEQVKLVDARLASLSA